MTLDTPFECQIIQQMFQEFLNNYEFYITLKVMPFQSLKWCGNPKTGNNVFFPQVNHS